MSLILKLKQRLERLEGRIPHMYLDTADPPQVTVGVGHMISAAEIRLPATNYRFEHFDGSPANQQEIKGNIAAVRAAPPGKAAGFYRNFTLLTLPNTEIDRLLDADIQTRLEALRITFPRFDQWPEPAQEAVFDMAFNLGLAGLLQKFPNCTKHIRDQEWLLAARICHRMGISENRNQETRNLFLAAATQPKTEQKAPGDPATDKYKTALQQIASLPDRFGHFNGADAATEAVRIAKEALQ